MTDEPNASMTEVRDAGYCARGQRRWLNEKQPDWKKWISEGIPMAELEVLHPALAAHLRRLREAAREQKA